MDDGYSPVSILLFLAFVALSAVFYGFGAAIQNMNGTRLEEEMEKGDLQSRKLLQVADQPRRFIDTIQFVTHVMSLAAGVGILAPVSRRLSGMLAARFGLTGAWLLPVCTVAAALALLVLLIVFGVIIPKEAAARNPEKWGMKLLSVIHVFMALCLPVTALMDGLSWLFLKLAGIDRKAVPDAVTEEDIVSMVNEGHEKGVLEADEAEMITNIFELDDKNAEDVMTHRKNVVALDSSMTLREALRFILKEGSNSRYPVYREDIDDVIGILHMRDAVIGSEQPENQDKRLDEIPGLLMEPHFIPETRNLDTLFKEMQSQKIHMEIVVDEYGQLAGIVTMEDILEEIVGNILDEYDVDEEFIVAEGEGSWLMSGMAPLDEVSQVLGIEFDEEDEELYDTVNGFLISKLGRIPAEGEQPAVSCLGYEFQVLKVENKMIQSVRAVAAPEGEPASKAERQE